MTTNNKPLKISNGRYKVNGWYVSVERHRESTYACGTQKTTTWSTWHAHRDGDNIRGDGGIRNAVKQLSK